MHTLKRTALAVAVVGVMLVSGACSSDGSDGAKDTTTTTAATGTTKPGGTKPNPANAAKVAAFCKAKAAQKGKYTLQSPAEAAKGVPYVKAVDAAAPQVIKADTAVILDATEQLAKLPADDYAAKRKLILGTPEVKKAYGRIVYFSSKNCK